MKKKTRQGEYKENRETQESVKRKKIITMLVKKITVKKKNMFTEEKKEKRAKNI